MPFSTTSQPAITTCSAQRHVLCISSHHDAEYVRDLLITLNDHRARHQALPATWEDFLYHSANRWAKRLVKLGCLQRGGYPKECGESVAYFPDKEITGKEVIDYWYQEWKLYNWLRPGCYPETQNFTQMVWKSTRHVGLARQFDEKGGVYVVAHYVPAGNGHGDYDRQVCRAIPDNYDYFASYEEIDFDEEEFDDNDEEDDRDEDGDGPVEEVEVEKPPSAGSEEKDTGTQSLEVTKTGENQMPEAEKDVTAED